MKKLKPLIYATIVILLFIYEGFMYYGYLRSMKVFERQHTKPQRPSIHQNKTKLATIPSKYKFIFQYYFTSDGKYVLYKAEAGNRQQILVINEEERIYDYIREKPSVSRDGKRIAYTVTNGNKEFVVINGQESKGYDKILSHIYFSSDSKHFAYKAVRGKDNLIIYDGQEIKPTGKDIPISFNLDGTVLLGSNTEQDEKAVKDYEEKRRLYVPVVREHTFSPARLSDVTFSPDGKQFAYYVVNKDDKCFMVLNGKEQKIYECVMPPFFFSPDSKTFAYKAEEFTLWFVVINGKQEKSYQTIGDHISFSPDSKRFAYFAREGKKYFMVVNGKEGKRYDWVDFSTFFSNDSKQYAYKAREGKKHLMVVNETEGKRYDDILDFTFAPDNKQFIYKAKSSRQELVVANGNEGKRYSFVGDSMSDQPIFVFSSDGKSFAYKALNRGKWVSVQDNNEGERHNYIGSMYFSTDGKTLNYGVVDGDEAWWIEQNIFQ